MATALFEGVFRPKFAKMAKMTVFEQLFSNSRLFLPHILRRIRFFLTFHLVLVYLTWFSKILASFGSFQAELCSQNRWGVIPTPPPRTGRVKASSQA